MKKIVSLLLVLLMLAANVALFASCGIKDEKVKVIDISLTEEQYAYAVKKGNSELLASINSFLGDIKANGEFEKILDKYFGDGTPEPVKSAVKDTSKEQIIVATNAAFPPFEYTDGDSYLGVDMEIMSLYAKSVNKELVIDNMDFESVCTSVGQGLCDVGAAGLTINETRKEIVDFSDSYYNASQMVILRESDTRFDSCTSAAEIEEILKSYTSTTKVGTQGGTTGFYYCKGDADWGFDGFPFETLSYTSGALAVQAMLNGSIDFVIIDEAPAKRIAESYNK